MTMTTCNAPAHTTATQRPSIGAILAQIIATHSQRRALGKLDRDALNDLGLTYAEAKREAKRPFWDIPAI